MFKNSLSQVGYFFGRPSPVEVNAAHLNLSHQVALCKVIRLTPECGGGDVCVTTKLWKHLHASRDLICIKQNFCIATFSNATFQIHMLEFIFKWKLHWSQSDTPLKTEVYIYIYINIFIYTYCCCLFASHILSANLAYQRRTELPVVVYDAGWGTALVHVFCVYKDTSIEPIVINTSAHWLRRQPAGEELGREVVLSVYLSLCRSPFPFSVLWASRTVAFLRSINIKMRSPSKTRWKPTRKSNSIRSRGCSNAFRFPFASVCLLFLKCGSECSNSNSNACI